MAVCAWHDYVGFCTRELKLRLYHVWIVYNGMWWFWGDIFMAVWMTNMYVMLLLTPVMFRNHASSKSWLYSVCILASPMVQVKGLCFRVTLSWAAWHKNSLRKCVCRHQTSDQKCHSTVFQENWFSLGIQLYLISCFFFNNQGEVFIYQTPRSSG